MRHSIASLFAVAITAGCFATSTGCSGSEIAVGSGGQELKRQHDGQPTGDGTTCSWSGTRTRIVDRCGAVPTPPGYGPYEVGEDFLAPDGCNECTCTDRGIMCTVRACNNGGGVACTDDAKECPDGSFVGRVAPNCEFAPCPGEEPVICTSDAKECPDGSSVGRTGPNCEFAPCPGEDGVTTTDTASDDECPIVCTTDVKECPDGSIVGRVAPNCSFAPCPDDGSGRGPGGPDNGTDWECRADAKVCPDGSTVGREGPNCEFAPCPDEDPVACTLEAKECPDGSYVGRMPPSCEFTPCPGDGYDPCEGKACGDTCTLCPPDAIDCAETSVVKYCQPDGTCHQNIVACE